MLQLNAQAWQCAENDRATDQFQYGGFAEIIRASPAPGLAMELAADVYVSGTVIY
jgi:hypothetical protein